MALTSSSGSPIPLGQAEQYIRWYLEEATNRFAANPEGAVNAAVSFDMDSLNRVLKLDGCAGIRLYFGLEEEEGVAHKSLTVIVVGIDENGHDIGLDTQTLEPTFDFQPEERGTKTISVISNKLQETNRALLLERVLR